MVAQFKVVSGLDFIIIVIVIIIMSNFLVVLGCSDDNSVSFLHLLFRNGAIAQNSNY